MLDISLSTKRLLDRKCDAYAFFVEHGSDFAEFKKTAGELYPYFDQAAKERLFTGKAGSSLILNGIQGKNAVYLIFLGLGDLKSGYGNVESYRRAVGTLIRIAESHKLESIAFDLPDPLKLNLGYRRLAIETASIAHTAAYHFDEYITSPDRKFQWVIKLQLGVSNTYLEETQDGLDRGFVIGEAINTARRWCDMPPSDLTPPIFAKEAQQLAKEYGLKATVFDKKAIVKMRMGGIEGVCRGSVHEPRLVILEYKAPKAKSTICLVGKGVTFDTGGLCIKPSAAMEGMKDDMAGAGVVLAAMKVVAQLKPQVNVVAVAPLVENMPSGSAQKPGDVLRAFNGKTMEVVDTDAEGRLILADALSYAAATYKPDAMIDFATLTGACRLALGFFYAGLFTNSDWLAEKVIKASEHSGDRVWRMPMDPDYRPAIKSDIADVKNVGSARYMGGAITAALFLETFVGNTPWVHLDTAGPAFGVPDLSYLRPGATGFGIRLLFDLLFHWHDEEPVQKKKAPPAKKKKGK